MRTTTRAGSFVFFGVLILLARLPAIAGEAIDATAGELAVATAAWNVKPEPVPQERDLLEELVVVGRFVAVDAESALKRNVRVLDTPAAVDNYSQGFMKAIETTNVADLYSYMTGVQRGGATGYDISFRGFKTRQTDLNAILVDGMPGITGLFGSPTTASADHIEVVKGPTSVLYGEDQPGGLLNIITKKPSAEAAGAVDVIGQGYDGMGLSLGKRPGVTADVDLTGPLNHSETLLYRMVLEGVHKDFFRGSTYEHSSYIAPSLSWVISPDTLARVAAEVRNRAVAYDNFLVAPNKDARLIAAPTLVYQSPNDIQPERATAVTASLDHSFSSDVTWHTAVRTISGSDDVVGFGNAGVFLAKATSKPPLLPAVWVVQRQALQQHNEHTSTFLDSRVTLPLITGFVSHKVQAGVNGGIVTGDSNIFQALTWPKTGALARPGPASINVDVYDPNFAVVPSLTSLGPGTVSDRYTREASAAGYLSDLMTLGRHWKATAGFRFTHDLLYVAEHKTPPLITHTIKVNAVSPMVGLMFEPSKIWTLYASYTTSFVPVAPTNQDVNGNYTFKPESAYQYEVGTKLDVLDGRLDATLALFDLQRVNGPVTVVCAAGVIGTCSQQVGEQRSTGAEFELNTHLTESWQTLFGYAYMDARITKSSASPSASLVGSRLTNSSRNNAHLWTRYDVQSGPLKHFGLGAGAFALSNHTGTVPNGNDGRVLLLPGYAVVDLALYYSMLGKYDLTMKVGNVFDKLYYEGVNAGTDALGVVPGSPRYVQLSLHAPLY